MASRTEMGITGERMVDHRERDERQRLGAMSDDLLALELKDVAAIFSSEHRNHLLIVEAAERLFNGEG